MADAISTTARDRLMAILEEPRGDEEISHYRADNAIIAFIDSFDPELAKAIDNARDVQNWWYA